MMSRLASIVASASVWLAVTTHCAAQTTSATNASFSDQQIIRSWGWMLAQQKDLAGIEISPTELTTFLKGFSVGLGNEPAPFDLQTVFPDVERLAKARREKLVLAATRKNEALAKTFFQKLKQKTNIVELPDGLCYETLRPGNGSFAKPQQTVTVHYTGRLIDGTEFEQLENYNVVLVTNRLSACLFAGIRKIQKGGAIKLFVPPPLPEGDDVRLGIPLGSAIVYDIELLDIKDTSPDDLAIALLPPAPEPPALPPSGLSEPQIIETWGWGVARETHANNYELSSDEISALTTGLADGIRNLPNNDLPQIYPSVKQFIAARGEHIRLATKQKRLDEMIALFAQLKQNTNIIELPDGLRYEIVKAGTGPYPQPGQVAIADYTGRLVDGRVFDRTDNEPLHMQIGLLMPGLNEGLQKINKGGELKLYAPPALGYGDEDSSSVISSVPADSVLIYDIKLLEIENTESTNTQINAYSLTAEDKDFFEHIKAAVLADDAVWLSTNISYPLKLGDTLTLQNTTNFLEQSTNIFNDHLKSVLRNQSADVLFKNWQGVMIGNGVVWFSETQDDSNKEAPLVYRITAINQLNR